MSGPEVLGVGVVGAGPVTQAIHLPTLARLADRFRVAVVLICSPPQFHAAQVEAAGAAGVRAVLCEMVFANGAAKSILQTLQKGLEGIVKK